MAKSDRTTKKQFRLGWTAPPARSTAEFIAQTKWREEHAAEDPALIAAYEHYKAAMKAAGVEPESYQQFLAGLKHDADVEARSS